MTRVSLTVTPLKPLPHLPGRTCEDTRFWIWDVSAEESVSGTRHAVGRVTCAPVDATRIARESTGFARPDFVVVATIVEPTPTAKP